MSPGKSMALKGYFGGGRMDGTCGAGAEGQVWELPVYR